MIATIAAGVMLLVIVGFVVLVIWVLEGRLEDDS